MHTLHPHMRGIIYALISYTLWVIVDALIKGVSEFNVPTHEIVAVIAPTIAVTIIALQRRTQPTLRTTLTTLWPRDVKKMTGLAIIFFGAQYFCIIALAHLPLNYFYIAVFTAPLTITLLAYFFLKENLAFGKLIAIICGFIGVVLALWPTENTEGSFIGYAAALGSATFYAISVVWMRKILEQESAMSMTFFSALFQSVVSLAMLLVLGGGVPLTATTLLLLVLAGITNAGGNLLSSLSVTYAPAATASAYHYSQLVTGAIVAYFIWHEIPSIQLIVGAGVIVASGLYIALHTHNQQRQAT